MVNILYYSIYLKKIKEKTLDKLMNFKVCLVFHFICIWMGISTDGFLRNKQICVQNYKGAVTIERNKICYFNDNIPIYYTLNTIL